MPCSRGLSGPGGAWSRESAPRGVLGLEGVCSQVGCAWSRAGGVCSGGVCSRGGGGDPPGRLLLRAVRILLECILVLQENHQRLTFTSGSLFHHWQYCWWSLLSIQFIKLSGKIFFNLN